MRKFFVGLASLQMLAIAAQFFLAASGAFATAPKEESFQPHRALGWVILLIAVLMTVVAAIIRMPGRVIGMSGLVAGLVIVQSVIKAIAGALDSTAGDLLFGLHAVNGLVIMAMTRNVIHHARQVPQPAVPARQVS